MKLALILPLLAVLPLSAQDWEASLFVGGQNYNALSGTIGPVATNVTVSNKTIYGLRLGYQVADWRPCVLQVTGAFYPQATSDATFTASAAGLASSSVTAQFKSQQVAAGAMVRFKLPVELGIGTEARFEHYSATFSAESDSQNVVRPWLRGTASYTLPGFKVKPFIGLEASIALSKYDNEFGADYEPELRDVAPKAQFGVQVGVRF